MQSTMSGDALTRHQLMLIDRVSRSSQAGQSSMQYALSAPSSRRKTDRSRPASKKPPLRCQGVDLCKQLVGSTAGVLRYHFEGRLEIQLREDVVWAAEKPERRIASIVDELAPMVVGLINNQDGKIADPLELLEKLKAALRVELEDASSGMLRVEACSQIAGRYRIRVKPVKKHHGGDGRPAKRIERMKSAMDLRRQVA